MPKTSGGCRVRHPHSPCLSCKSKPQFNPIVLLFQRPNPDPNLFSYSVQANHRRLPSSRLFCPLPLLTATLLRSNAHLHRKRHSHLSGQRALPTPTSSPALSPSEPRYAPLFRLHHIRFNSRCISHLLTLLYRNRLAVDSGRNVIPVPCPDSQVGKTCMGCWITGSVHALAARQD